jgi:hypothetical protein
MAKKRTINEIRQTKEYYTGNNKPSKSFIEDQEAAKQHYNWSGEKITLVDVEQEDPVKQIMAQQIEEEMNPSKYTEDELEQAKCAIVEKILKHFDDTLFEMVCEEMSNNYLFQSQNYLTEAGYDIFEDEWFEFYHEHHGDILAQLNQRFSL